MPYLWYLSEKELEYALRELFEGVCGNHLGAMTITHKLLRGDYY